MAIHCDICGTRLSDARENGGSFPVAGKFVSRAPWKGHIIGDTCLRCAAEIKAIIGSAVAKVVESIRAADDSASVACEVCGGVIFSGTRHDDQSECIVHLKSRLAER